MFDKLENILNKVPLYEIEDYLLYTCGDLKNTQRGCRCDIISKLKFRIKYHKLNKECEEQSIFFIYNTFAWIDYLKQKYGEEE